MIIENEKDERAAAWLIEKFGAEEVKNAETRLKGSRRAYPSNLAKVLGVTLPDTLNLTKNAAARQKLALMIQMLEKKI